VRSFGRLAAIAGLALCGVAAVQTSAAPPAREAQETPITTTHHAEGTFDVKLTAQPLADGDADPLLGRRSLEKVFHGDLEATSRGEMLMAGTEVKGSAGYVAIERVAGWLHGRRGAFVLQHTGTMNRGVPELSVSVVPDSGTGALTGLSGKMHIIIEGGLHGYSFDYTLPE
jgi:Protein of unknown function (DUF3224)